MGRVETKWVKLPSATRRIDRIAKTADPTDFTSLAAILPRFELAAFQGEIGIEEGQ